MVNGALGVPLKMAVLLTVEDSGFETRIKSNNDLPKPLMIEWSELMSLRTVARNVEIGTFPNIR